MITKPSAQSVRGNHTKRIIRRGAVAVAAVVLLILLNLIIVGMVLVGARHQDATVYGVESVRAFYAAEAARDLSLREFSLNEDIDGDGVVGRIAEMTPDVLGGVSIGVMENSTDAETILTAWGQSPRVRKRTAITVTPMIGRDGLVAYYHAAGQPIWSIDHVDWSGTPDAMAHVHQLNWPDVGSNEPFWIGGPTDSFGARFVGWINIPQSGLWTFETESDDGSTLYVNESLVVDNDGLHSMQSSEGMIELTAGWQRFEVRHFENAGDHGLVVRWQGPGVPVRSVIPPEQFAHTSDQLLQPLPLLAVRETIAIAGQGSATQCFIDAYDPAAGAYDANATVDTLVSTNSIISDAVDLARTTVYGDVRVGVGGEPNDVVNLGQNAVITGETAANDIAITTLQIIVPDNLPGSAGSQSPSPGTHVVDEDFHYDDWTIGNNVTIAVTDPIVGRISGDLTMSGSGQIQLTGDGRLTLHVFGNVSMSNSASINANTDDPERVRIFVMPPPSGTRTIDMSNQAAIHATIINPAGDLSMSGQGQPPHSQLFGRYFGRALDMSRQTRVHVNHRTIPLGGVGGSAVRVSSWAEVPPN